MVFLTRRCPAVFGLFLLIFLFLPAFLCAQQSSPPGLRIIVVHTETEAQNILDRLNKGEDFAALAKEKSTDSTAEDGGYVGVLDPSSLRRELRDALVGVKAGETTGIIKVSSGYAILKVMSEDAAGQNKSASQILPLAARGNVRYSANVGGAPEADAALQAYPKPDGWEKDLRMICQIRQESLGRNTERLEGFVNSSDPSSPQRMDIMQVRYVLGQLLAYQGKMDQVVSLWEDTYRKVLEQMPQGADQLEEALGAAYLHKSEMDNDVYRKPGDRCLFPPVKNTKFTKTAESEKAIQYFEKFLAKHPQDLEVKWLLNLAYMTLGQYPAGVPQKYLIAPSNFASKETIGRFHDIAPEVGLNLFSMAGGIIVDDFDNDGQLDVVTSSYNVCEHMYFYHNNGDGTFSDRTEQAGLLDQLGGLNIVQTDYNNDGCLDIMVMRGGWQWPMRRSLLRNNCNGTFTDVTKESGLLDTMAASQTAVWADIDNDGFLDLFVGNEKGPSQLFRNKGDGTFEDISRSAGIDRSAFTKGVVAADYDNDGYPDFYVSNLNYANFLFHNNHDRTFTEVAESAGVQAPYTSFPAWFFDYDNDGLVDIFVPSYYMSMDEVMRSATGAPINAETAKLYRNLGNGNFKDVTAEVGLDKVYMPMGVNFGDVDNDGFLDMYLGNGNPSYIAMVPHVLLLNKEGKKFVDVTAASGTGDLHKGHAVALADMSRMGTEDILTVIGGAIPGDAHAFRFFKNPGNGNDWINLKLVGVKTNRAAIGARIEVTVENAGVTRSIYRTVGSSGSFGANPLEQHIGLGKAAQIKEIEIWWPTSNTRQNFANVIKNQFLEVKEFAPDYTKLVRKAIHFSPQGRPAVASRARKPLSPKQ